MFPMTSLLSDLHCLFQTIWNLGGFSLVVCSCVGHGVRRRKQARNRSKPVDQQLTLFLCNLQRSSIQRVDYFYRSAGYSVIDTLGENKKSSFFGVVY